MTAPKNIFTANISSIKIVKETVQRDCREAKMVPIYRYHKMSGLQVFFSKSIVAVLSELSCLVCCEFLNKFLAAVVTPQKIFTAQITGKSTINFLRNLLLDNFAAVKTFCRLSHCQKRLFYYIKYIKEIPFFKYIAQTVTVFQFRVRMDPNSVWSLDPDPKCGSGSSYLKIGAKS
jgi:hypothetical protein